MTGDDTFGLGMLIGLVISVAMWWHIDIQPQFRELRHRDSCPEPAPTPDEPVRVNYCTCAGPCPGYPQHEEHCGWITAEEAGTV